ncbi:putative MFS family arabinose efflux permease [Clostridium punense]|uniref:MFS family arabinose efflux permease n=1 Tax=Clostridium punense TaxID=1054297 RepID=A0ABS4K6J0_9CLOT|nr:MULTISPECIES: MFS transporter [Clostridium]EQB88955.1 hypothetical protein M918_03370 [Clostridium sp. BL8]MBP2023394.1 putative MFS family arabinose efflux permease [Clostridium punense]
MSSILNNKLIRVSLLSGLFSQLGIWIRNFSILLFVMDKTHGNTTAITLISLSEYVPIFIFSILGGTLSDRWQPKKTLLWCEFLSAGSVFLIFITICFGSWKAVFFTTFFSAILSQFSQPSGMKLFKCFVPEEQIQKTMSAVQTMYSFFTVLGPIIGTIIYQNYGINASIAIVCISFLFSAGVLTFIPKDILIEKSDMPASVLKDMLSGIRYMFSRKILKLSGICLLILGLAVGLISPLTIFLVTEKLRLPKEAVQWLTTVYGIGEILGGMFIFALASKVSYKKLLLVGLLCNASGILILGLSFNLYLTLSAQFLISLTQPCIFIGNNVMIIQNTEAEFIGRINGITTPLMTGSMVIAMSFTTILVKITSLSTVYITASLLFSVGFMVSTLLPNLKPDNESDDKAFV